jgi:hypothetical protein
VCLSFAYILIFGEPKVKEEKIKRHLLSGWVGGGASFEYGKSVGSSSPSLQRSSGERFSNFACQCSRLWVKKGSDADWPHEFVLNKKISRRQGGGVGGQSLLLLPLKMTTRYTDRLISNIKDNASSTIERFASDFCAHYIYSLAYSLIYFTCSLYLLLIYWKEEGLQRGVGWAGSRSRTCRHMRESNLLICIIPISSIALLGCVFRAPLYYSYDVYILDLVFGWVRPVCVGPSWSTLVGRRLLRPKGERPKEKYKHDSIWQS